MLTRRAMLAAAAPLLLCLTMSNAFLVGPSLRPGQSGSALFAATKPSSSSGNGGNSRPVAAKKPATTTVKAPTARAAPSPSPTTSSSPPPSPLDQLSTFFSSITSTLATTTATASSTTGAKAGKKEYVVAISGASGMIGRALTKELLGSQVGGLPVKVIKLVRSDGGSDGEVSWDPAGGAIDAAALEGVDAFVHLAGENVGSGSTDTLPGRLGAWSEGKKEAILQSRQKGTGLLANTIASLKKPPQVFLSASAVGYYGYDNGDVTFDETGAKGNGFLAEVSDVWEAESKKAQKAKGVRVVNARLGVVLSKEGGIVAKLSPIFGLGGGGIIGDGRQYLSWVSLRDAVRAIKFLLETPSLSGPVNVVSPQPVTNAAFTEAMGRALKRPTLVPFPGFAAKAIFGEMGDEMLLGGQRVVPNRLTQAGFEFQDATIDDGMSAALSE